MENTYKLSFFRVTYITIPLNMPSENAKNLTVPPFESKLPEEFTSGLDERGKYLYQTIDKITQAQDWLTQRAIADANTLSEVKEQTTRTNGRLLNAEANIREIKTEQEASKSAIKTVNFSLTVIKSKLFWAGLLLFITFGIPWLVSHNGLVVSFLKIWLG